LILFLICIIAFTLVSATRLALAGWYGMRPDRLSGHRGDPDVTIVQPILSGDPRLASCLAKNLISNPRAHFLWLVDEDDAEGRRIVEMLAMHFVNSELTVSIGPSPSDGENPKLAKLARGEHLVTSKVLLVLDDDTILPAGGAATLAELVGTGDLVTGIPVYSSWTTLGERLVSGFINSQAIPVYFSMAAIGANRSINGMAYAVRTEDLRRFGGFAAAGHVVTDDYAVAQLWASHGRRLVQSRVYVEVAITFTTLGEAVRVLRRWFIFANRYLSRNHSLPTVCLVIAPSILPAVTLPLALGAGWRCALLWLAVLLSKAAASGLLLRRLTGQRFRSLNIICEIIADVLAPIVYLTAFVRPSQLTWRNRRIRLKRDTIYYR
jgi:ceramide glucosyltransferase